MNNRNTTGIVLINYYNDDEVISFIQNQLFNQTDKEIRIFVLDNGSKDNSLKMFCENEPKIHYDNPGKNLGYNGGFLHVVSKLKGHGPGIIILSNTDIEFDDASLMSRIGAYDMQHDEVMMGPEIISTRTGHNQNPYYENRISESKLSLLSVVFSSWLTAFVYQSLGILKAKIKGNSPVKPNSGMRHVYAIHGSFMIFKTSFVEKYFAELGDAPFLFGEEIQFAETVLRNKLKILYCPQFKVKHHEHATTQLFRSGKMLRFLKDSVDFALKKRREDKQ